MPLRTQKPLVGTPLDWAHPLAKGLVGCWLFNEGSGDRVFDVSGNGNDGSIVGSPWSAGNSGWVLDLNGSSDYLTAPISIIQSQGSIALWIRPDYSTGDSAVHGLFGSSNEGAQNYIRCEHYSDNNWYIGWDEGGNNYRIVIAAANMPMTAGYWYFFVFTWDDTTNDSIVYLNAVEEGNNNTLTLPTLSNPLRLGGHDHPIVPAYHDGFIDQILILDYALSRQEIQWLYREPYAMFVQDMNWLWGAVAAPAAANPKGPLGHPLMGALGGPI